MAVRKISENQAAQVVGATMLGMQERSRNVYAKALDVGHSINSSVLLQNPVSRALGLTYTADAALDMVGVFKNVQKTS